jgi:hypothetical protein
MLIKLLKMVVTVTYNPADSDMQIQSGFGGYECLNEAVSGGRV